jgi:hypothetical protein
MARFGHRLDLVGPYLAALARQEAHPEAQGRVSATEATGSATGGRYAGKRYAGLHPESFLRWCLMEAHPDTSAPPLRRVALRMRAVRVRATGLVDHRDWALVPRQDRLNNRLNEEPKDPLGLLQGLALERHLGLTGKSGHSGQGQGATAEAAALLANRMHRAISRGGQ